MSRDCPEPRKPRDRNVNHGQNGFDNSTLGEGSGHFAEVNSVKKNDFFTGPNQGGGHNRDTAAGWNTATADVKVPKADAWSSGGNNNSQEDSWGVTNNDSSADPWASSGAGW